MSETLYEFPSEVPAPPQRKWLVVLALCPVIGLAIWGVIVLERMQSEALVNESFQLEIGLNGTVSAAISNTLEIRDEDLSGLAVYPHLHMVNLSGTKSGTLRPLPEISDLRALFLRNCAWVDDDQTAWLRNLDGLKYLDLSGTNITDAGLLALSKLNTLYRLDLSATDITDAGLVAISKLKNLNGLNLGGTNITDVGLLALRDLPQLHLLNVQRCPGITDAGLETCTDMHQLHELWVGETGCSVDGLFALREHRRDLMLQLDPSDMLESDRRSRPTNPPLAMYPSSVRNSAGGGATWDSGSISPRFVVYGVERLPDLNQHVTAMLSTADDVETLSRLLRFKQNWDPTLLRGHTVLFRIPDQGNYVEHIEETWTSLELSGPAAGSSLTKVLPLTPKLAWLNLRETTITSEDFPLDLVPPDLRQLYLANMAVNPSLLERLLRHAAVMQVGLWQVRVDAVDIEYARLERPTIWLQQAGDNDVANVGDNEEVAIELHATQIGRALEKLVPLVPPLTVLKLQCETLDAEDFPIGFMPPRLQIKHAETSEAFLQKLARRSVLEHLVLSGVFLNSVNLDDPALGQFKSLKSMQLDDVKINGVDLADPSLEPLRERLKAALPGTRTRIVSSSNHNHPIEWGNPSEQGK